MVLGIFSWPLRSLFKCYKLPDFCSWLCPSFYGHSISDWLLEDDNDFTVLKYPAQSQDVIPRCEHLWDLVEQYSSYHRQEICRNCAMLSCHANLVVENIQFIFSFLTNKISTSCRALPYQWTVILLYFSQQTLLQPVCYHV